MAGVQAILMVLAEMGLLIYPRCRLSVSQIHQKCKARKTNENTSATVRELRECISDGRRCARYCVREYLLEGCDDDLL